MNKKVIIALIIAIILIIVAVIVFEIYKNTYKKTPQNIEIENNIEDITQNNEPDNDEAELIVEIEEKPNWQWQKDNPENHNVSADKLKEIHNIYDTTQILSSVIVKDDYIIDEYYKNGYDEKSIFPINSCSKSITSALIGIAIDKGYIKSVDVPVLEYFPQIQNSGNEYAKQMTIEHLLTHTSGIALSETRNWNEWRNSENWIEYILNHPVTSQPGTRFVYSTTNTHLLSAILQKATGMTVYEFGKKYLFEPLQMESIQCGTDAQGISDGGNGFTMNIYDMLKFGRLYLNNGVWEGQQIIPTQWIEESSNIYFKNASGNISYGYQWWIKSFYNERYVGYFAQGYAGQFIYVIPELNLVIAFTSKYTGSNSMPTYAQYIDKIISAYV